MERQCDREFLDELSEQGPGLPGHAFHGLRRGHTVFGRTLSQYSGFGRGGHHLHRCEYGRWGCGTKSAGPVHQCMLTLTGGICPVSPVPQGHGQRTLRRRGKRPLRNRPGAGMRLGPSSGSAFPTPDRLDNLASVQSPRDNRPANLPGRQVHPAYERRFSAHE